MKRPMMAKPQRVWRTYRGGMLLDCLEGKVHSTDSFFPEAWILSEVQAINPDRQLQQEGICMVNGIPLNQLIGLDAAGILGEEHVQTHGPRMGVLVKLIDAAERLTIQVHPNKKNAKTYFCSNYGKTECWHILDTRSSDACIYLGFREDVSPAYLRHLFDMNSYDEMLELLHRIPVRAGDTYFIPGGVPHAIGAGCLILEIQEPTDYTLRLERVTSSGHAIHEHLVHQGIGIDNLFRCIDYRGIEQYGLLLKPSVNVTETYAKNSLVDSQTTDCFRMTSIWVQNKMNWDAESAFSGIYILEGEGSLFGPAGEIPVQRHDAILLPAKFSGQWVSENNSLKLIFFQGPTSGASSSTLK